MTIYQCDRCGCIFEADSSFNNIVKIGFHSDSDLIATPTITKSFDICRDCANSLRKWYLRGRFEPRT